MATGPRFIPLQVPGGQTIMVTPEEYHRAAAAAARTGVNLPAWLAVVQPRDEADLRAKARRELGR